MALLQRATDAGSHFAQGAWHHVQELTHQLPGVIHSIGQPLTNVEHDVQHVVAGKKTGLVHWAFTGLVVYGGWVLFQDWMPSEARSIKNFVSRTGKRWRIA